MIPVGTRSLLFGVHHIIWHPITVFIAWVRLYGLPSWQELICIIVHDWGYWGSPNMDGDEGDEHPLRSARYVSWMGFGYERLVVLHSRHLARTLNREPSRLCWADKLSHLYYPVWLYLTLARLSGELAEYRQCSHESGYCDISVSDAEWFRRIRADMARVGVEMNARAMWYTHGEEPQEREASDATP